MSGQSCPSFQKRCVGNLCNINGCSRIRSIVMENFFLSEESFINLW